jgi:biopolymer transport protein ExbD
LAAISEGDMMADINVTPLVDVMLVLLIIFIITIRVIIQQVPWTCRRRRIFRRRPSRKTSRLPSTSRAPSIGTPSSWRHGRAQVATARHRAQEPQPEVHIRGDANVRYQFVGQVLVTTQQIGIRKVAFITEPDHFGPGYD